MSAESNSKSRNRKRRHGTQRTTSQSSVEIQVTQTETALISPACGSRPSAQPALFTPAIQFLEVIKTVGAKGSWTPAGDEVFTIRQLCHYLTEYIGVKELFDPFNPLQVFCKDDPLGQVFGVEKFSKHEALKYVLQQCSQVIPKHKLSPARESRLEQTSRSNPCPNNDGFLAPENPVGLGSHSGVEVSPRSSLDNKRFKTDHYSSTTLQANVPQDSSHGDPIRNSPGMRRTTHLISEPGPSRISPEVPRRRQSSFSIVYNSDGDGSSPWGFTLELQDDSGDESVYSVQSKETVMVHSSTDDYWFLETESESDQTMDQISLQMDEGGISVEFNQANTPFPVEFEVDDQSGRESPPWYDTDGSESPIEEIFVVYDESDEDFWADSESSEFDSGNSTDEELEDGDKWICNSCQFTNNPVRRFCDRCWSLRTDWLPDHARKAQANQQKNDFFGLNTNTTEHNTVNQSAQENLNVQSNSKSLKQSDHICPEEVSSLKRAASLETLRASDIDEASVSLYNNDFTSSQASQQYHVHTSLTTTTSAQETYKARIALDFECPPLKKNDSGLGCSLSNIDLPSSQESVSLTSSQESTSSIWKASDSAYSSLEHLREKLARSPKTVSLTVPKSATSVVRVISPLKSPIKILHHYTGNKNILSQETRSQVSPLKNPEQILKQMSPLNQLLSPIHCASPQKASTSQQAVESLQDVCIVCMAKPKEASIIHGKTGHQVCCYVCAKRLRRKGKPCPVCRRPIQKVIKNYLV